MKLRRALVDANLLILLIVGATNRRFIKSHKRLTSFTQEDYDLLAKILGGFEEIIVTPHTLTEASNLALQTLEPARSEIAVMFRELVSNSSEWVIGSVVAANRPEFSRLGLTDAVLLEAAIVDTVLISTDLDLCVAAEMAGAEVINFNHVRDTDL